MCFVDSFGFNVLINSDLYVSGILIEIKERVKANNIIHNQIKFNKMKNVQTFTLVLVLLFISTLSSKATNKSGTGVSSDAKFAYSLRTAKGTDKFILAFDNFTQDKVKIKIFDSENHLVFSEVQTETESARKSYDLSELTAGKYSVKIESGVYSFTEQIEIGKNAHKLDFDIIITPDIYHEQKLRVGFANAKADVKVEIQDETGTIVHSEIFTEVDNATQLFNMEFLQPGIYSITVSSNGKSMVEAFVVQ